MTSCWGGKMEGSHFEGSPFPSPVNYSHAARCLLQLPPGRPIRAQHLLGIARPPNPWRGGGRGCGGFGVIRAWFIWSCSVHNKVFARGYTRSCGRLVQSRQSRNIEKFNLFNEPPLEASVVFVSPRFCKKQHCLALPALVSWPTIYLIPCQLIICPPFILNTDMKWGYGLLIKCLWHGYLVHHVQQKWSLPHRNTCTV